MKVVRGGLLTLMGRWSRAMTLRSRVGQGSAESGQEVFAAVRPLIGMGR